MFIFVLYCYRLSSCSGGAVEAAGLGGDELRAGGAAVDDVLGRAEAPEPQVE